MNSIEQIISAISIDALEIENCVISNIMAITSIA
jgi:hypothetical protein